MKIKLLYRESRTPTYATDGSAGLDLSACINTQITLTVGECRFIGSGIAINIDDPNLCAMIIPRSGLGHHHGIILGNSVGLIDSDYQGELLISIWNRSRVDYTISPGDRIAQLVFLPILRPTLQVVDSFEETIRGVKGFGSTGVQVI